MNANRALWKSVEEALNSLGRPTMKTLTWQLSENGVSMAPDNFDVNKFDKVLKEFLGEGSEVILNMIYRNMCRYLKTNQRDDQDLRALEEINRILEAEKMS
ncbi:MAG: hypothetical protein AB1351_08350 [Thermoproteota archaeon]